MNKRILLVDDEPMVRDTLGLILKNEFDVFTASSGEQAIEVVQNEVFPVVVLDLRMPGMGGIETLKVLRKMDAEQKVIILTAHQSTESAIHAVNSGAFNYMTKPCDIQVLKKLATEAHDLYFQEKERIERFNKRLIDMHDNFFSVLCHEFNTPLNSIIGFASLLSAELEDISQRELAHFIEMSGKELHEVFIEIIDFINCPSNKLGNTTSKIFTLDNVTEALVEYCQNEFRSVDINFARGLRDREFAGPHNALLSILQKIAVLGVDVPGALKLKFRYLGDKSNEPKFLIADLENTGLETLLDEDMDLELLFTPYTTAAISKNGTYKGLGLELPTCRKLAEFTGIEIRPYLDQKNGVSLQLSIPIELP